MKIRLVGAELFHENGQTHRRTDGQSDRQTDVTKLIVALRNIANAPQKASILENLRANQLENMIGGE
jgi:hypothetical protein